MKCLTNPFEVITYSSYCKHQKPMTLYEPISRAYFKLWEIITEFNLINPKIKYYNYSALAEGPGGFVECFVNYRKKCFQGKFDNIYCMTLQSKDSNIPNWKRIHKFLNRNQHYVSYSSNLVFYQIHFGLADEQMASIFYC